MNNLVQRVLALTAAWQAASDLPEEIATVDVLALPTNVGPVEFLGDRGDAVPWSPGEWHSFPRINLAHLQVRGLPGDRVTIVGGAW